MIKRVSRGERSLAMIRVYGEPGNVIKTHEHHGEFREFFDVAGCRKTFRAVKKAAMTAPRAPLKAISLAQA